MDHAIISIGENATMATPNERLEALKARYVPTPNNQQQVGDGDLNKIMDRALYKATIDGDADKFIDALEAVSESRKLALSLIFDQVTPSGNSLLHVAASSGKDDVVELILIHFPYLVTRKNSSDDTPLHVAVQDGRLNATRKLISRRRDSDIIYWKNKDSKSPLYLAVKNCEPSDWRDRKGAGWEILQLLLRESARDEDYAVKIQGMSPVLAAFEEWELGVQQSEGRDVVSPREECSGASESSPAGWIKDQVNTLLVVATLVASVTFTAGVTLPGGYNASDDPHPGMATMLHKGVFQVFVIANTLAMYSSILAVVVLLWGLSRDFYVAELAYHLAGPLLLMALTGMSVAFFAAVTVAVSKLAWLTSLVLSVGVLYLAMVIGVLAALIFPSSKSAMRIVVFYYLALYAVGGFIRFWFTIFAFIMKENFDRPVINW